MFARLLIAPLIFLAVVLLGLAWSFEAPKYALGLVPLLVAAAVVYVLSPQINWWWYSKRPPELPARLGEMLARFCPFYQRLGSAARAKFRQRVALFRMATDWTPAGWPEDSDGLPPDVELAIAAQAVIVTFGRPEFVFDRFEKVIVYPVAFPSPEYQFFHASELYEPDGCLLFSAGHVVQGFAQPGKMYNIALHEYARVFVRTYARENYPDFESPEQWERLEKMSGMSRQYIESFIGLAGVEALAVAIHHYFTFGEPFREAFPEEAAVLEQIFEGP
jgi:hypothetical protein